MLAGLVERLEVPAARIGARRRRSCCRTRPRSGSSIVGGAAARRHAVARAASPTPQAWTSWHSFVTDWYWSVAIVSFVIFVIAAVAETNHPPFDLVEAEQELVGGFHTEYTGIRFAIFFLAEFMNVITMSAIAVTLFLGGPSGPALGFLPRTAPSTSGSCRSSGSSLKLMALLFGTVWLRASLPRLRYDQLMELGWKWLIELAFLSVMVTAS